MKRFILVLLIQPFLYSFCTAQTQDIMTQHSSPKNLVLSFYKEVIGNRKIELLDTYVHKNYIQHSPMVKDGREGLRQALAFLQTLPEPKEKKSPILLALEEGNLVFLFLQVEMMGKKLAVMELFRVEENKIAEHWDATEEIETFFEPIQFPLDGKDHKEGNATIIKTHLPKDQALKRILAEGNFILTQSAGNIEGKTSVFYDLFLLEDEKINKHWQVKQIIPEQMMHGNGMF